MDIEKYIEEKCRYRTENSASGVHDRAYERALRGAYHLYGHLTDLNRLKLYQEFAREEFRLNNSSHIATAKCMVLMELIKELS